MATNSTAYTLRAGKMDRRIEIQSQVIGSDSYGGSVSEWAIKARVWCEVVPMRSEDRLMVSAEMAAIGARGVESLLFRVRYRDDVEMTDRILYNGKPYSVMGIQEIGRREAIEIRGVLVQ